MCKVLSDLFTFLLVRHSLHDRFEEKDPQNSKKDEELQEDDPYKGPAPGHILEPVAV